MCYSHAMIETELVTLALSLPDAAEGAHFGKRDFRVRGKVFLTLPEPGIAVLKLTPDQQKMALAIAAEHFTPVKGGWGLQGWTRFSHLDADREIAEHWVGIAWRNAAPRSLMRALDE